MEDVCCVIGGFVDGGGGISGMKLGCKTGLVGRMEAERVEVSL